MDPTLRWLLFITLPLCWIGNQTGHWIAGHNFGTLREQVFEAIFSGLLIWAVFETLAFFYLVIAGLYR